MLAPKEQPCEKYASAMSYLWDPIQGMNPGVLIARMFIRLSGFRGCGGEGDELLVEYIADALSTILKPQVTSRTKARRRQQGVLVSQALDDVMDSGVCAALVAEAASFGRYPDLNRILHPLGRHQLLQDAAAQFRVYCPRALDAQGLDVLRKEILKESGLVKRLPTPARCALLERKAKTKSALNKAEQDWLNKMAAESVAQSDSE